MNWARTFRQSGLALLVVAGLCGCQKAKDRKGATDVPLPPMTYAQIAESYNARVERVQTLWVRSVVEIRWKDKDGKKHFEQGDGPLIIRKPSELALAIGKLGNTRFWLGCDADRYWLFDLHKPRKAYVGKQSNVANAARQVLPLPIRPDQMIGLIGLRSLPDTDQAQVEIDGGRYRLTLPPDQALGGMQPVLWLDAQIRPVRIQLRDGRPSVIVDAELSKYSRMKLSDAAPGAWPSLATRVHMVLGDGQATVTLFMRNPIDGTSKIKDAQFNFEKLVKLLKVEQVEDVDQKSINQ